MATISPYLNFPGNTEEAFNFYRSVFGGEFTNVQRFRNMQGAGPIPEADADKIMHISLPISKETVLMATDALESLGQKLTIGDNFSICLNTESEAEADKLYHALSEGGKIQMALEKTFWGAYFGMLTDKFGIQWMVNYDYKKK